MLHILHEGNYGGMGESITQTDTPRIKKSSPLSVQRVALHIVTLHSREFDHQFSSSADNAWNPVLSCQTVQIVSSLLK